MTKPNKQDFYEEQVPELLAQMTRIADALERQVELMEERQAVERESLENQKVDIEGQRAQRRQRFEAQLQKLAEVDRMARELRSKLEEKQAAEAAAKDVAESADESSPVEKVGVAEGKAKVDKKAKTSPPTEN